MWVSVTASFGIIFFWFSGSPASLYTTDLGEGEVFLLLIGGLAKLCLGFNALFLPKEVTASGAESWETQEAASLHGSSYQNTLHLLIFSHIKRLLPEPTSIINIDFAHCGHHCQQGKSLLVQTQKAHWLLPSQQKYKFSLQQSQFLLGRDRAEEPV